MIQKARFLNFELQLDVSQEAGECEMIQFLVQPVVENAIVHGFERGKYRRGVVSVRAHCEDGALLIEVADNGVGFDLKKWRESPQERSEAHGHIAIDHIEQLIALEYGEGYGMKIESTPGAGCRVSYRLPAKKAQAQRL